MNKISVFFLLFVVGSMIFITTPNTVQADPQLEILIKIALNTKEHIKSDIDKISNVSKEAYQQYDEGVKETDLLIKATTDGDTTSARQHFVSAMVAFKKVSMGIENLSNQSQQLLIPDRSQTIKKYESNIKKLKIISQKLKADVNFDQIDQLLTRFLAKLHPLGWKFINYYMK